MQYGSLQYQIFFLSPVPFTTGWYFCFGSVSSFFLELFLQLKMLVLNKMICTFSVNPVKTPARFLKYIWASLSSNLCGNTNELEWLNQYCKRSIKPEKLHHLFLRHNQYLQQSIQHTISEE